MNIYRTRWVLILALLLGALNAAVAAPLDLRYHLSFSRPTTHLAEVEIRAAKIQESQLDFVIPAWAPGRYAIYDFAKNVQDFSAQGSDGKALEWKKIDKQTWRVQTASAGGTVTVTYRVFGNDLTGSFSQIDSTHAAISGPSVFMYVDGHKPDPLTLSIESPKGWKVVSGFSLSESDRTFRVPNYDILVDTPLEISAEVVTTTFVEKGKTFRVAVHSPTESKLDLGPLTAGLRKVVSAELSALPEPDFQHYTFLCHFDPTISQGDGMEHLNSTALILTQTLSDSELPGVLELAAHEFFHVWNVKRLRPSRLGPFDYTREQYSNELWFAEGLTNYYSYVYLYRAGLLTRDQFLAHLTEEIRTVEGEPGRKVMSAESSSFHAWFYDRSPQMQQTNFANTTLSYYNKGAVLGLLLDLEIRARSGGAKSLDDVFLALYHKFYAAPAESYYLPGRGYTDDDVLAGASEAASSDMTGFFNRIARSTEPLPYEEVFAAAGLELQIEAEQGAPPALGVLVDRAPGGVRIQSVRPGSAAESAGLSRDDIITAVDGLSLETTTLADRLSIYTPKADVLLTVQRRGREQRVVAKLDPPTAANYSIRLAAKPTPEQLAVRTGWLAQPR